LDFISLCYKISFDEEKKLEINQNIKYLITINVTGDAEEINNAKKLDIKETKRRFRYPKK